MPPLQLIGMVHLDALPGSPRYQPPFEALIRDAVRDAMALEEAGFDAILVENYGDAPYFADEVPAVTVAGMARAVSEIRRVVTLPLGVNILRNDSVAALSVAAAGEAEFIRVNVLSGSMYTDQGLIEGTAARIARLRASLCPDVEILADVFVKHATPPPGLLIGDAAADLWRRAMADGLIVSGAATGSPTDRRSIEKVREAVPNARILVGSGVTADRVSELVDLVEGMIVGTAIKEQGDIHRQVDADRAGALVRAVKRHR